MTAPSSKRRKAQSVPRLRQCVRTDLCVKGWIAPNGRLVILNMRHADWLLEHHEEVGLDLPVHLRASDEQEVRVLALRAGFARLNWHARGGALTIEANRYRQPLGLAGIVRSPVRQNPEDISAVHMNLLDLDGGTYE